MAYQPVHQEGMHKNENEIKRLIVDTCRRGCCDHEGRDIPLGHRGRVGKGSHYIANHSVGIQSSPKELIERMRKNGLLPKKERNSHAGK
jgi:hypothetical protein